MSALCRCCNAEIPPHHQHLEIMVSKMRATSGAHATGPVAAVGCYDCGDAIVAGILHVARLWTPADSCAHHQTALFQ